MTERSRVEALVAAALVVLLALTGCTTSPSDRAGSGHATAATPAQGLTANSAPVNAVDIAFASTLTRIGGESIELAGLVAGRSAHPELADLVPTIQQHAPDLDELREWLAHWRRVGISVGPTATVAPMSDISAVAVLHGTSFDDRWLEHMGRNYVTAIAACDDEIARGANLPAQRLARDWSQWMRGQYNEMWRWHSSWMKDDHFPAMGGTPPAWTATGTHHPEPPPRTATGTHHPESPPHMTGDR